jgi:hypothetical protein
MSGATLYAFAAFDASARPKDQLEASFLPFWIMAPPTTQRASLEKYSSPNARTILDSVFFNIKNNPILHCWSNIISVS